ncbi:hypothetical protein Tco_0023984 [Tanacetum coccineum]
MKCRIRSGSELMKRKLLTLEHIKNLLTLLSVTLAQTKTIIDSLQNKLHDTIYENAKLRAQLFDKVSDQVDTTKGTSTNTKFANQKVDETNDLSKPVTSNSVPTPQDQKMVIGPGSLGLIPFKPSRRKKDVNSDSNGLSSTGVDNTAKTRRPQPRSNTKNDRVPSASKSSCNKNKEVEVEEHHRNLLLSKNKKHMSSECKHVKLDIRNDKSEVVCAMCKQCLLTANHDVCMLNYVNAMNSRGKKQKAHVSNTENQKKQKPKVIKPKNVGSKERLASPKPSKPRFCLRWSPTGRLFDIKGKIIASSESESQSDCSNGDNACTSNPSEPKIKRFPNSTFFLGRRILEAGAKVLVKWLFSLVFADSCAYRVYNRRTKKIMETMNATFDELSAMAFEQHSSKPGTSRHDFWTHQFRTRSYLCSVNITTKNQLKSTSDSNAPYNNSRHSTDTNNFILSSYKIVPNSSQDVDELETQQHVQHQPATIADNVP